MEMNDLVDRLYEEIVKKLKNKEEIKTTVCVVSSTEELELEEALKEQYNLVYFAEDMEDSEFERIIIPRLSIKMLANLANGVSSTREEEFILTSLLKGKKVAVLRKGVEYYAYKQSSPAPLYKMYNEYEEKLEKFGISFEEEGLNVQMEIERDEGQSSAKEIYFFKKRLVTEAALQKLYLQSTTEIMIDKNSIITPLAKDFIRTHHLKIIESGK
ncbi:hypothetical protein [Robertmurraya siralis]|uniref:hypothetical protein n=1 Tax=Robertmurraya siralis TaxID=77777 RepID=UPI0010F6433D|nr:hypothetical protein [Robertmurraya siralis]